MKLKLSWLAIIPFAILPIFSTSCTYRPSNLYDLFQIGFKGEVFIPNCKLSLDTSVVPPSIKLDQHDQTYLPFKWQIQRSDAPDNKEDNAIILFEIFVSSVNNTFTGCKLLFNQIAVIDCDNVQQVTWEPLVNHEFVFREFYLHQLWCNMALGHIDYDPLEQISVFLQHQTLTYI